MYTRCPDDSHLFHLFSLTCHLMAFTTLKLEFCWKLIPNCESLTFLREFLEMGESDLII